MFLKSLIEVLQANAVIVGLLVGAVTPLVTSLVQQPNWSKRVRVVVSLVVSGLIGLAVAGADGSLDPANLLPTMIAVWTAAEAFYQKVWKKIGATQAVEKATSLKSSKAAAAERDAYLDLEDDYDYGPEPDGLEYK